MLIDIHVHERTHSPCALMSLEEAVEAARVAGLDAVCITNHNSLDIRYADYLKTVDFPVFVGVEMRTVQGDILAYGLDSLPFDQEPDARDFVDFVVSRNAFCCAAHPFRRYGGGIGDYVYKLSGLHGVEVFNGANREEENHRALAACRELGLVATAGSDAHEIDEIGRFALWLPEMVSLEQELACALKSGKCRPMVRRDGIFELLP